MVDLATRNAAAAGVTARATFIKADLFETDFSKAQVITMFLLPTINLKLRPTILNMRPGTRIVSTSFTMEDWQPDQSEKVTDERTSWCTTQLWIVPAPLTAPGRSGTKHCRSNSSSRTSRRTRSTTVSAGRVCGDQIEFSVGNVKYPGKVDGTMIKGTTSAGAAWSVTKE